MSKVQRILKMFFQKICFETNFQKSLKILTFFWKNYSKFFQKNCKNGFNFFRKFFETKLEKGSKSFSKCFFRKKIEKKCSKIVQKYSFQKVAYSFFKKWFQMKFKKSLQFLSKQISKNLHKRLRDYSKRNF
jgi:hypothetical protein